MTDTSLPAPDPAKPRPLPPDFDGADPPPGYSSRGRTGGAGPRQRQRRPERRSEVLLSAEWRETCRPRVPLPFKPVFTAVLVLLGLALGLPALLERIASRPVADRPPVPPAAAVRTAEEPAPRSARAVLAAKSPFVYGIDQGLASEAGWDLCARMKAEAIRLETENRLARTDLLLVLRLAEWRRQLGRFQDLIVELAEVAHGGGTWAGHETDRNDLGLEELLLAPHALALGEVDGLGTEAEPVAPAVAQARLEMWQKVWQTFESRAATLRDADQVGEFWKEQLPWILKEARELHDSLAGSVTRIRDADAAAAVTRYLTGYLDSLAEGFPGTRSDSAAEAPAE